MKQCTWCHTAKPIEEFHRDKRIKDGHKGSCRTCENTKNAALREANRQQFNQIAKNHYAANAKAINQRSKQWKASNKHRVREYNRSYEVANRGKRNAINANRKAKLLQATPEWADAKIIEHIYVQCAQLSVDTGGRFEVDHIIPLDNKHVCGLHVEANLRIITKSHNCSKRNRFVI